MRCIRAVNVNALNYIVPLILDDPDFNKDYFVQIVAHGLRRNDPTLLVLLLLNDDDTKVIGYAIAEAAAMTNYVWLWMFWSDVTDGGKRGTDLLWARVQEFARHVNRRQIRAETKRSIEAAVRSRNVHHVSNIVEYRLNDDIADVFTQESNDGRRNNDKRLDNESEELTETLVQLRAGSADGPGIKDPDRNEDPSSVRGSEPRLRTTGERSDSPSGDGHTYPSVNPTDQQPEPDPRPSPENPLGL